MLNKKIGLVTLLAGFAASEIMAGTITNYASGDVLVCFRKGGNDMVVDAGPISTLTSASVNQRIPITQYTGTQLADVGTNGVSWSAFTWLTSDNSLYITRPRSTLNQQTAPWTVQSDTAQSTVGLRMATIPPGALDELNLLVYPESTASAVVEEDSSSGNPNYTHGVSYHDALAGAYGSAFNGYFQGNPENTTINGGCNNKFTLLGLVSRSDFYQLTPGGSAIWLGYFELNTNGVMTYVAYPPTTPVINSISRSGTTATIKYQTGLYGTYTLRGTTNISAPVSTWPVVTTLSTGDTLTHNYPDTDSTSNKFYIIKGQ